MVITKGDLARKRLNFDGGDNEENGAKLRPRNKQADAGKDTIDLNRMSSASFMNMLGEGPSTATASNSKNLKKSKKVQEKLKTQNLVSINDGVLNTDSVNIEDTGNGTESSSSSGQLPEETGGTSNECVNRESVIENPLSRPSSPQTDSQGMDTTMALSADEGSQTEPVYMLCTCDNCKDLVRKFSMYINKGYSSDETCIAGKHVSAGQENDSRLSLTMATKEDGEERVSLFKGSQIKISVTAKGKLKCLDRDEKASPKDFIYAIMDDLFSPITMANMTAAGRTKGSAKMDPKIKDGMQIYLQNKFEDIDDITKYINAKCYAERRKLWGKSDELVRKPLPKNVKKSGEDDEKKEKQKEKNKEMDRDENHKDKNGGGKIKKKNGEEKITGKDRADINKEKKRKVKKASSSKDDSKKLRHDNNVKKKLEYNKVSGKRDTLSKRKSKTKRSVKSPRHSKQTNSLNKRRVPFSPAHQRKRTHSSSSPASRATTGHKRPRKIEDILQISSKEMLDFENELPKDVSLDAEFADSLDSSTPLSKKQSSKGTVETVEDSDSSEEQESVEDEVEDEEEEESTSSGSDDKEESDSS